MIEQSTLKVMTFKWTINCQRSDLLWSFWPEWMDCVGETQNKGCSKIVSELKLGLREKNCCKKLSAEGQTECKPCISGRNNKITYMKRTWIIHIYQLHRNTSTHLLKDIVELLQRWSHGPVAAHTACIAVEVNVGQPVQSVVTKGTDHRGPHRPVLIIRRFIQIRIISGVNVLSAVEPLHQEYWRRFSDLKQTCGS